MLAVRRGSRTQQRSKQSESGVGAECKPDAPDGTPSLNVRRISNMPAGADFCRPAARIPARDSGDKATVRDDLCHLAFLLSENNEICYHTRWFIIQFFGKACLSVVKVRA